MPEAAAKTEKPEAPPAQAPAKGAGGGGGKLVPALLALNSLLMVAMLALTLVRGGLPGRAAPNGGADHGEAKAEAKAEGHGGGEAKPDAKAEEHEDKDEQGAKAAKAPGPTLKLPDFVVHLRDTDADRYARMTFEVELRDEKGKEELTARMPVVRDAFLLYLSDRKAEDLRGADAILQLKNALTAKLGEAVPGLRARALYVTELVVQ